MGIKFDGTIKLDINIAISATVTVLIAFSLLQNNATQQEVGEIKPAVENIPKEVKDITRNDVITIFERFNEENNSTKLTQNQILLLSKQILREVR